jgi:predicted transposase/invertase (TIGR01784 family)
MTIEELMENRYSEGKEEGKKETALKMLKRNYSFEEISELTELSIEEIEKLQTEK